jgi:hypothetical protein
VKREVPGAADDQERWAREEVEEDRYNGEQSGLYDNVFLGSESL